MPLRVLRFNEGDFTLSVLDQSKLPFKEGFNNYKDAYEIVAAIKKLKIRGSVLLGIVTGYAFTLEAFRNRNSNYDKFILQLKLLGKELIAAQPLNYNIVYVVDRMLKFIEAKAKTVKVTEMYKEVLQEAKNIESEEIYKCDRIALNGLSLIKNGYSILTYCNSGILSTGGIGTGLGIIYKAYNRYNGNIKIYISETRPLFEGMKLTCWELSKTRTQFINISDNMVAYLLSQKRFDICIVGADKSDRNGNIISRIGTYNLAVLCKAHNVPFVVALPSSSTDLELEQASGNLIQARNQSEIFDIVFNGNNKVPKNYVALNFFHDITPYNLVSFYVNEKGVYTNFKKLQSDLKNNTKKEVKTVNAQVRA